MAPSLEMEMVRMTPRPVRPERVPGSTGADDGQWLVLLLTREAVARVAIAMLRACRGLAQSVVAIDFAGPERTGQPGVGRVRLPGESGLKGCSAAPNRKNLDRVGGLQYVKLSTIRCDIGFRSREEFLWLKSLRLWPVRTYVERVSVKRRFPRIDRPPVLGPDLGHEKKIVKISVLGIALSARAIIIVCRGSTDYRT
jgi:hypothetical protein